MFSSKKVLWIYANLDTSSIETIERSCSPRKQNQGARDPCPQVCGERHPPSTLNLPPLGAGFVTREAEGCRSFQLRKQAPALESWLTIPRLLSKQPPADYQSSRRADINSEPAQRFLEGPKHFESLQGCS